MSSKQYLIEKINHHSITIPVLGLGYVGLPLAVVFAEAGFKVIGVAYKPDIDDMRESPALDVIHLLQQKGANVSYHDPFVPQFHHDGWDMCSIPNENLLPAVAQADAVVILTNHTQYDYAAILQHACLIIDTRNALGALGSNHANVVRL
jgi:UDP-N-acetyl-D-glucosamine dehydrogenase